MGFSGGVDSAFVLASSKKWAGVPVYPLIAVSCLLPPSSVKQAEKVAFETGCDLLRVYWEPLSINEIADNGPLRCYFCKKNMYISIKGRLYEIGYGNELIVDGTQFDDLYRDRPGLNALRELDVLTPLASIGFTKTDIRWSLWKWGYSFWNTPPESCLATRIPWSVKLTEHNLGALYFELESKKTPFS